MKKIPFLMRFTVLTPIISRKGKGGLALCLALLLPSAAFAMQELSDETLGRVDAQDGVVLEASFGPPSTGTAGVGVSLDRLYWEDNAGVVLGSGTTGTDTALRGYSDGVTLYGKGMGATVAMDFGTYNSQPGINLDVTANIGTAFGRSFKICDGTGANCGSSLGALTIQTSDTSPLHFNMKTSNGLFSQTSIAQLLADIRNVNIYMNQAVNGTTQALTDSSTNNQLLFKNFNFSFLGTGYLFISDTAGFTLQTACPGTCTSPGITSGMTLNRVTDPTYGTKTLPGLNLEMMYKSNSGIPTNAANYNLTNAGGLIHLGVSGEMTNASLVFRGTDATGTTGNASIFGPAVAANGTPVSNLVMGSGGFGLNGGVAFKRDGSNPVTLELGHAGNNAYGVQFGNLSPLQIRTGCDIVAGATAPTSCGGAGNPLNTALATFSTGNIYVDLAATKKLLMPANATLNAVPMGTGFLTTAADYSIDTHSAASNPNMLVVGIRNMDFNSVSRNSRFIVSNDVTDATIKNSGDMTGFYSSGTGWTAAGSSWGLGLPFYHVNVDTAFYGTLGGVPGTEQRIGGAFALGTTGRDATGANTTSILLIDGAPNANDSNNPTNYYVGLRNIDMYMAGQGSIGLNGDSTITSTKGMNINISKFTLALAGEVATGYLPGAKKKTGNTYSPSNNFALKDDVLFGLRLKLAGNTNLVITPGDSSSLNDANGKGYNFPRLMGNLNLSSGALQLVEPVDGTILGFDSICGTAGAVNACDGTSFANIGLNNFIRINKDSVDFGFSLNFNPTNADANVFRVKDVEMFAADGAGGLLPRQRWGELALTGGNITTMLTLKPR